MTCQFLIFLCVFVAFTSCETQSPTVDQIAEELEQIATIDLQKEYLQDILSTDQEVRSAISEMIENHGYDSEEHKKSEKAMSEVDEINLVKIEMYLDRFGYPTLKDHGSKACTAPYMVLHHQPDLDSRKRNFKYLYSAYESSDIDDHTLTFFLNRMYAMTYGERIEWDGPYLPEQELDTLFKSLNLLELIDESEQKP